MNNGTYKLVKDLRKGDIVKDGFIIICVVCTLSGFPRDLTSVGSLCVTPGQPIYVEKEWVLSRAVRGATVVRDATNKVYNFVLDRGHVLTIEDTECVTLGHKFEGPVVSHPYFGTDRVVDDLRRMRGWDDEFIPLIGTLLCPDGTVCGLVQRPARDPTKLTQKLS
jgi:hypothetical protein